MSIDIDLASIQEVRNLIKQAKEAQREFADFSQQQVDLVAKAIAQACAEHAIELARMAVDETGFGKPEDKALKNLLGSKMTWDYVKDMKTVGILREDKEKKITEIGVGVGVIAALIPSTNPTSTTMYKSIISVKAGNAIIISPHPTAKNSVIATAKIVMNAARKAGAPEGLISYISMPTKEATDALLKHRDIGMILATGGEAMMRAAYTSGNPALGVGPGNGPSYIEKTADIPNAVKHIIESKTFDNGTICASEQSIVTERCIEEQVLAELKKQGGYLMSDEESGKVGQYLLRANGTMNPKIVGKPAVFIAEMSGISVPADTKVLVSRQTGVSHENPYSREKLCPVIGFYVENSWQEACTRCIELLMNEGVGHTMTIHSQDESVIREFALKKPVSRLLVNTAPALGGVGATTGLAPAFTLGCGAVGGSATSDNVTPLNLINIRRVAYGTIELSDLRNMPACDGSCSPSAFCGGSPVSSVKLEKDRSVELSRKEIEAITQAILEKLRMNN